MPLKGSQGQPFQAVPAPLLTWSGTASGGSVRLRDTNGEPLSFYQLAPLADHLRSRGDRWGGFVRCAAAHGVAQHGMQHVLRGGGSLFAALDEAAQLLADLPVNQALRRLRACVEAHRDLLGWRELATRMVLEACRIQSEQEQAVTATTMLAAAALPRSGRLLLAWPGGPACDLSDGLLVGSLLQAQRSIQRTDEVLVAGPSALAAEAVAHLEAHGVPAKVAPPEVANAVAARGPLAGVLVRAHGAAAFAEPQAVALASAAASRRVRVFAVGAAVEEDPSFAGLARLPGATLRPLCAPPPLG